ncbi:hypothetical protein [Falsihalocynthiibacter arcticus]|uniref:hypothetical protein n=1 Tax=Falsihalocynthiibacter arcticus TaxID=1579316 RepID=UPI003002DF1E
MKTTKLIHATNPDTDRQAITQRLTDYLMNLRKTRLAADFIGDDEHSIDLGLDDFDNVADDLSDGVELTWRDNRRIKQRVQGIVDRRKEASGLAHLKDGEIKRLRPLFAGIKLFEPKNEHWVDERIAALHEEMPWMAPATNEVWSALRQNAATGDIIKIPPLILIGPPGIGKSVWARRLSELPHIPRCEIDASLGGVGFSVAGTERGCIVECRPCSCRGHRNSCARRGAVSGRNGRGGLCHSTSRERCQ